MGRFDFSPSVVRAEMLDADRHADLAESLSYIAGEVADVLPDVWTDLGTVVARLRAGAPLEPRAFGLYYALVDAIDADAFDVAARVARDLARVQERDAQMGVAGRGTPQNAALDAVIDARMGAGASKFAPVSQDVAAGMAGRIEEGMALLEAGLPELAGEIRCLVRHVVVAQEPAGAAMKFDGASHYQFWGLLFLNPNFHPDRLAVAEVLAHEAGHSLLFGMTDKEPLVLNPDEALYPSPLRKDPRPMDGIYHATFVSARMAFAMEGLAASCVLTEAEVERAQEAAAQDRVNFAAGYGVVAEHGALSATGRAIMQSAKAWIDASAP